MIYKREFSTMIGSSSCTSERTYMALAADDHLAMKGSYIPLEQSK